MLGNISKELINFILLGLFLAMFSGCGFLNATHESTEPPSLGFSAPAFVSPENISAYKFSGYCPKNDEEVQLTEPLQATFKCKDGTFSGTLDFSSLPDGLISIKLVSKSMTSAFELTKDTVAPTAPTNLVDGTWGNSKLLSPMLSWDASIDATSGVDHYEVRVIDAISSTAISAWSPLASGLQVSNLNLIEASDYKIEVRAVDKVGNKSTTSLSDGWTVDSLAPVGLSGFNDMNSGSIAESPKMDWASLVSDAGSGVTKYEISLGTSSGASDIVGWTNIGSSTNQILSGLSLTNGSTYYTSLRATDAAGNSSTASGDGWRAVEKWKAIEPNMTPIHGGFESAIEQSDGSIVIGGGFSYVDGFSMPKMGRINTDGSNDSGFDLATGFNGAVFAVTEQTIALNRKYLVGGGFSSFRGIPLGRIARLNEDGSLDSTFNNGGIGFNSNVKSIVVQSDNKILIGGDFTTYNGSSQKYIIRLNVDGSVDSSFNASTTILQYVTTIALQSDNKIVVGGGIGMAGASKPLVRLNVDGSVDGGFSVGTGLNGVVYTVVLQSDNKILIGGIFTSYNGSTQNRIARLDTNGTLDAGFITGTGFNDIVYSIAVQSDGRILVGGSFTSFNTTNSANRIARLESNGSIDTSFVVGTGFNSQVNVIRISTSGAALVGGLFTTYQGVEANRIIALAADGQVDSGIILGTGLNSTTTTIHPQSNGKIILAGNFDHYKALNRKFLAKFNSDGTLDSNFNSANIFFTNSQGINALVKQTDGKMIAGGGIVNEILRLNLDGTIDTSFVTGTGPDGSVYTLAMAAQGKIVAGGYFGSYNGSSSNRLARLNPDGSYDSTLNIGSGFEYQALPPVTSVFTVVVQSDDKIIVGGIFDSYNGSSTNSLVRLNVDGTLDSTFNIGSGPNDFPGQILIQTDGKIIVTGSFTTFNGAAQKGLIRLNANGSKDPTFDIGSGFTGEIGKVKLMSDGKLMVGGYLDTYMGVAVPNLIRLNPDGSLDTSFNAGTGPSSIGISEILELSSKKIFLGGDFISFDGKKAIGATTLGW